MKELEDSSLFPSILRNYETEFIGFVVKQMDYYREFIKYLQSLDLPRRKMFDLCSGSGEPAVSIFEKSKCFSQLILSDKFPDRRLYENKTITYLSQSMDVTQTDFRADLNYTMFNAFHHFADNDKKIIVKKIHDAKSQAFVVEILNPSVGCLLKVLLMTTIGTTLLTPFVTPFSLSRIFFTYIIPVNVLTITYDGVVSVLKSRSLKAYRKLFAEENYVEVFQLKNFYSSMIVIKISHDKAITSLETA